MSEPIVDIQENNSRTNTQVSICMSERVHPIGQKSSLSVNLHTRTEKNKLYKPRFHGSCKAQNRDEYVYMNIDRESTSSPDSNKISPDNASQIFLKECLEKFIALVTNSIINTDVS